MPIGPTGTMVAMDHKISHDTFYNSKESHDSEGLKAAERQIWSLLSKVITVKEQICTKFG